MAIWARKVHTMLVLGPFGTLTMSAQVQCEVPEHKPDTGLSLCKGDGGAVVLAVDGHPPTLPETLNPKP